MPKINLFQVTANKLTTNNYKCLRNTTDKIELLNQLTKWKKLNFVSILAHMYLSKVWTIKTLFIFQRHSNAWRLWSRTISCRYEYLHGFNLSDSLHDTPHNGTGWYSLHRLIDIEKILKHLLWLKIGSHVQIQRTFISFWKNKTKQKTSYCTNMAGFLCSGKWQSMKYETECNYEFGQRAFPVLKALKYLAIYF